LIRHAIDALGIRDVVDRICPPDPRNEVADGDCVAVMILNILHGRVSLYEMGEWLSLTDVDLLLGEGTPPDAFNDDRLGHCLDRLFHAGTEYIFSEVARGILTRSEIGNEYSIHTDTTSVSLQGRYEEDPKHPWPDGAPIPALGFSKDLRPDLKQLIFGLSVHGPTRIPLGFSVLDGNTADCRADRFQIESLAQLLPSEHEVTLVADCKFVDGVTLGSAQFAGFHYISLLPHTFKLRKELVEAVRKAGKDIAEVGRFPGKKEAPERIYRATSFVRPFNIVDVPTQAEVSKDHRFLVVRSSTQEVEFDSTIERRIEKEATQLTTTLTRLAERNFGCQTDLQSEIEKITKKLAYHKVINEVGEVDVPLKRPKAGRPRKDELPPTERVWRMTTHTINRDDERISIARFHAAHFVLVSDHVDSVAWPDERLFSTWRSQESVEGHAGFRWLKNVAEVAPVFLKLPHRVQALALILMFALMVRNWMEAHVRAGCASRGMKLPNFNDKPISRPTAENVFYLFRGVTLICHFSGDRIVGRDVYYLDGYALDVLDLFGVSRDLFISPPRRKWRPSPPGMCGT
jgi:transposase